MIRSITDKLFLIFVLALAGCTGLKNISSDDSLYIGHEIKFTAKDDQNKKLTPIIKGVLKPDPNTTFLWMRPALARNNMLSDKAKKKKFWKKKITDPVLISQTNPTQVAAAIQNRIFHHGYFQNTVAFDTVRVGQRKAKYTYTITLRVPHRFESIVFPKPTNDLTQKISSYQPESLLKKGVVNFTPLMRMSAMVFISPAIGVMSASVVSSATIADIGIALFKERAYNAVAAAQYAATFPPPAGVVAGAAYLLRANVASIIRAGIATARVLAFKQGGWTGDGQNDEPAGIVHKNEYVIPAHITQNPAYGGILGVLENARLRGFEGGGLVSPKNPFSDSSRPAIAGNSVDAALQNATIDYDKLSRVILSAMDQKVTTLHVVNNLQETEKGLSTLNTLRNEANV